MATMALAAAGAASAITGTSLYLGQRWLLHKILRTEGDISAWAEELKDKVRKLEAQSAELEAVPTKYNIHRQEAEEATQALKIQHQNNDKVLSSVQEELNEARERSRQLTELNMQLKQEVVALQEEFAGFGAQAAKLDKRVEVKKPSCSAGCAL